MLSVQTTLCAGGQVQTSVFHVETISIYQIVPVFLLVRISAA